jgi:hypothetical protein
MSNAALDSSVTLEEVLSILGSKRVPLAPELAGYLVLEIVERVDESAGDIEPSSVFVGEEGTVALVKPRRMAAGGDTEASLRSLLGRLLEASGSLTPALSAAARRASGAGLQALAADLETALIPVNRAAGRRALARLAREVRRVKRGLGRNALPTPSDASPAPPARVTADVGAQRRPRPAESTEEEATTTRRPIPTELLQEKRPDDTGVLPTTQFEAPSLPSQSQADVDALIAQFGVSGGGDKQHARALGKIVGLEPTPAPVDAVSATRAGSSSGSAAGAPAESDVESLLALGADAPAGMADEASEPHRVPAQPPLATVRLAPSTARRAMPSAPVIPSSRGRTGPALLLVALLALGAAAYFLLKLRPPAEAPAPSPPPALSDSQTPARAAPAACNATLVVTGVPQHAEVLLREGQAPLDVEKMPVGARLEFVATAEGYAPKRVVVPAGATWDTGSDGKPRFEAAVQLDKSKTRPGSEPWPPGEPGSEVGGQGPPGIVRVVATPRGAEVWMLAGIGPEARVEQLRCDRDLDVLVAGPTTFRKRLHVSATDFEPETQSSSRSKTPTRIARVSVQ